LEIALHARWCAQCHEDARILMHIDREEIVQEGYMAQGVILSTGDIKTEYEIVDIVFAVQVVRSHFVRSGGRETLEFLPQVNDKLREAASAKGATE